MKKTLLALSLLLAVGFTFAHDKGDKDKKTSKKHKMECCKDAKNCTPEMKAQCEKDGKKCCDMSSKKS